MDGKFYNHICSIFMPHKCVCKIFLGNDMYSGGPSCPILSSSPEGCPC